MNRVSILPAGHICLTAASSMLLSSISMEPSVQWSHTIFRRVIRRFRSLPDDGMAESWILNPALRQNSECVLLFHPCGCELRFTSSSPSSHVIRVHGLEGRWRRRGSCPWQGVQTSVLLPRSPPQVFCRMLPGNLSGSVTVITTDTLYARKSVPDLHNVQGEECCCQFTVLATPGSGVKRHLLGLLYTVASEPPGEKTQCGKDDTFKNIAVLFIHIETKEPAAGQACGLRGVWQREPRRLFSCTLCRGRGEAIPRVGVWVMAQAGGSPGAQGISSVPFPGAIHFGLGIFLLSFKKWFESYCSWILKFYSISEY